jgi:hypothetical protein
MAVIRPSCSMLLQARIMAHQKAEKTGRQRAIDKKYL